MDDEQPGIGDKVVHLPDVQNSPLGGEPVGIVIDNEVVAADSHTKLIAVQFPHLNGAMVVAANQLRVVERAGPESRVRRIRGLSGTRAEVLDGEPRLREILGPLLGLAASITDDDPDPGVPKHVYQGHAATCAFPGCGQLDRHELHILPPYRLEFLDEIPEGATVYLSDEHHMTEYTLYRKRELGGIVACILIDQDGDQRPFTGPVLHLLPVKIDA